MNQNRRKKLAALAEFTVQVFCAAWRSGAFATEAPLFHENPFAKPKKTRKGTGIAPGENHTIPRGESWRKTNFHNNPANKTKPVETAKTQTVGYQKFDVQSVAQQHTAPQAQPKEESGPVPVDTRAIIEGRY